MDKKYYFILSPAYSDTSRVEEVEQKAASYYGQKEYASFGGGKIPDELFKSTVEALVHNDANADVILISLTALIMSQVDSIYVARDWDEDEVCKFCHMIAFKYGIDMVYESF